MPGQRSRGLRFAATFVAAAFTASLGCQDQMAWVPANGSMDLANGQPAAPPANQGQPEIQKAGYQPGQPDQPPSRGAPGEGGTSRNCAGPNGSPGANANGGSGGGLPNELQMVSHPPYVVEPPDILLIDAVRLVPKPPYRVEPLDQLVIQATETFPNQPIAGVYTVTPDGFVNLGFTYGSAQATGLTLDQLELSIRNQLGRVLKNPGVSVGLAQFRGLQQIRGEHLVRPDGTISLGTYGSVHVAGLTLAQIKTVVERQLCQYLKEPEVAIDVFAYNSKAYYVITDGAGYGMQVYKFPITGKETVLDAINAIQGLPAVASKRAIWVARPSPCDHPCNQILPVDWMAIVQGGSTCTNYQLFPGDRIYVKADCLISLDYGLAKILAPIERVLGVSLLGTSVYNSFRNNNNSNGSAFIVTTR